MKDLSINAFVKGDHAELVNTLVGEWLSRAKQIMSLNSETKWGQLKTSILRAKPWSKKDQTHSILKSTMSGSLVGSLTDYVDLSSIQRITDTERLELNTPDTDAADSTDVLDDVLNDSIGSLAPITQFKEEKMNFDFSLLEDYFHDLAAAEPDFNHETASTELSKVFLACSTFVRALYDKYTVANEDSPTGSAVPVVQFQIFVLEVNCSIEEREAKEVYDSLCGFDWDKSPKKIMTLELFAHALVRVSSLYLENFMSQSTHQVFTDFDGKQVSSHFLELLRHTKMELEMDVDVPEVDGIKDIRIRKSNIEASIPDSKTSTTSPMQNGTGDNPDESNIPWKLVSSFCVDSSLLEDLCEEIEDANELKVLLGQMTTKIMDIQELIIHQFAEAISTDSINTKSLDQYASREQFIAHAGRIDSLIDEETSDDVYSQLCGYPFEKIQKPMNLHIYVHAWIRLANLYSMFAAPDGNADFVDIVTQMDFLVQKLRQDNK
jgi:hypothetical protein